MKRLWIALAMVVASPAAAVTLSFDDLAGSSQVTSYDGFDFGNFYALDTGRLPRVGLRQRRDQRHQRRL